jgi:hypothetical protein
VRRLVVVLIAASSYNLEGGWDTAFAAASLVLLVAGVVAMIKKALRWSQALAVLLTAVVVGVVSLLATGFPSNLLTGVIVATVTVGGVATAAALILRPDTRRF